MSKSLLLLLFVTWFIDNKILLIIIIFFLLFDFSIQRSDIQKARNYPFTALLAFSRPIRGTHNFGTKINTPNEAKIRPKITQIG